MPYDFYKRTRLIGVASVKDQEQKKKKKKSQLSYYMQIIYSHCQSMMALSVSPTFT